MLTVTDTGMGMDEEVLSRIFEPFFTTKPQGEGTGLGLSTVYGIVKQSDGYIWVDSELGGGTKFRIYLPRVEAAVDARSRQEQLTESLDEVPGGSETVLVVEDDNATRLIVTATLQQKGYDVLDADTPKKALEFCEKLGGPPDLLLTDIVMPGTSGPDLAKQIRSRYTALRVLYTSGYADKATLPGDLVNPDVDFLAKPFSPSVLSRRVREALDRNSTTT